MGRMVSVSNPSVFGSQHLWKLGLYLPLRLGDRDAIFLDGYISRIAPIFCRKTFLGYRFYFKGAEKELIIASFLK